MAVLVAKSDTFALDLLSLVFNAVALPEVATGFLYLALHSARPATNSQQSNEATYTGYQRFTTPRNLATWSVLANRASLLTVALFPTSLGPAQTITHVSIGTATAGVSTILYAGQLNSPVLIGVGDQPEFTQGQLGFSEL
jgi:hypothetical protein